MIKRVISFGVLLTFVAGMICPPGRVYAQAVSQLPAPGTMISLSPAVEPLLIKGLKVHPENPFLFDFILDAGNDAKATNNSSYLKEQSTKLIKYFLAAMTVPEKDLWVNLSPYEKDRMISENLGQTQMGRDMLAQDYILKQLTASLIYPEKNLGKTFWDKVYTKAQQQFGTTNIPVDTFNKVWIVAERADVYEHGQTAFIVGSHLKVMLEEDYKALSKHINSDETQNSHSLSSQVLREVVLPELEKEVNQGANFVPLRQMFYSMILASWYKMALKDALLTQVYGNQSKVKVGINANDPAEKDKIFQRYIQAYKKGVFNYIKEETDQNTQTTEPRKYFSGGLQVYPDGDPSKVIKRHQSLPVGAELPGSEHTFVARVPVNIPGGEKAMLAKPLQDALNMVPIMNGDQEQAIKDGKLEVGITIQGLGLEGRAGAAEEMAEVARNYAEHPGSIFRQAKYLRAYSVPDGIHNWGNVPGVMPLAEKILNELAPTPMSEDDIKAGKVRVHLIALESGGGTRAASLTVNAGNKGEIVLYGRSLLEQGIEQVKALAYGLPAGEYFVVVPCDNVILPGAEMFKQYSGKKGFYLYAKGTPALEEGFAVQYGLADLGQMLLDKEGRVKPNGFVEKPDLWELNYKILGNTLENANEDEAARKAEVAGITSQAAGAELLKYMSLAGEDLAAQLLPFVVKADVWNFKGETKKEKDKEFFGKRADRFSGMTREEWRNAQEQAQRLMVENSALAAKVKRILDAGGRKTYANTFYFTIRRDVMQKMVELYSRPTEKNNGSFWARQLEPGKFPINSLPDWSGHILTPMSYAANEAGKKKWMDQYWATARKTLAAAQDKAAKKGQTVDTTDLNVWAERATTYTQRDWEDLYNLAQEVKKMAGGMVGVDFGPVWADAGSPAEAKRILDEGTAQGDMKDIFNGLFGRPLQGDVAPDVTIEGQVSYTGTHVIRHSKIKVPAGVELVIGNNVRIEDSYLDIKPPAGVNKITIEDGVVIVSSDIQGEVATIAKNAYVNEVHTANGIGATAQGDVLGTLFTTKGEVFTTRHPIDVDIKDLRDKKTVLDGTPYNWDELIGDLENMEPKLIDRSRIRAERKALKAKLDEAMHGNPSEVGGIDLNRANMQMNIRKDANGVQMQFDRSMIQRIKHSGFDGLEFRIESILPVTNLRMLLGLKEEASSPVA
ncbi:MAG: hypothetical protein HQL14_07500 [Candidatus Omnitrophica bacterium]|nr:hypothetical protein [Candidatus Omnitrophota bacterium]